MTVVVAAIGVVAGVARECVEELTAPFASGWLAAVFGLVVEVLECRSAALPNRHAFTSRA